MAKRRLNREGTIYPRKNGTFQAQITIDDQRFSFTGQTQQECQQWIKQVVEKERRGQSYQASQTTYKEFLNNWLAGKRSTLKPASHKQYTQIARDYILPALGKIKLDDLRPDHIQHLYDTEMRKGTGLRTIEVIHAVIRGSLNHAVKLWIIGRNPALATFPPRPARKEMQIYSQEQVQKLIVTAKLITSPYAELLQLAIATGMRLGEILGLQWKDVDWNKNSLTIQRQFSRKTRDSKLFTSPKTKAGIRTIKVGEEVMTALQIQSERVSRLMWEAGENWHDLDLVFPSQDGKPLSGRYLLTSFQRIAKQAGLPKIRFHDLRHTAASLMLNNGIPVLIVSKRLGHAKPSITLDIYGHMIQGQDAGAADLMDSYITPIEVDPLEKTAPKLHHATDFGNDG